MKEIISKIEEVENITFDGHDYPAFDGFKITTDKQEIMVLISNGQSCCENWGYLSAFENNKEREDFLGAKLLKIEIVDTALNKKEWNSKFEYGLDDGDVMFVNFETSKGVFQLTAYNSHNGYYGHEARLISNQLKKEVSL